MKKTKFTIYGILIGAVCAAYGSAIFALLLIISFYGFGIVNMNPFDVLMNFVWATLFSAMFAVLPDAVGGVYLACWLEQAERAPRKVMQRGLTVGAVAGIAVSFVIIVFFFQIHIDALYLVYTVVATLVAAGMSWFGARLLAKDRKKFVETAQT